MLNKGDINSSRPINDGFLHGLTNHGRKFNEKIFEIVSLIWQSDGLHRKSISDKLKLSKGAVCRYGDALIKEDIVTEEKKANHLLGRNPVPLQLKGDLFYSIGISFTGTSKTKFVILDATNCAIDERVTSQEFYSEETCISLAKGVRAIIEKNKIPKEKIIGIGITLPGIISPEKGLVISSSRFSIKKDFNLKGFLEKRLGMYVEIINTSHIEPLMERKWGDAGELRSFLTISRHFSLGMYLNGQLYRGHQQMAGETGFFQFDSMGDMGLDGRKGTFNVVAPLHNIIDMVSDLITSGENHIAKQYLDEEGQVDFMTIIKACQAGDALCSKMLAEHFTYVARGAINFAYIFNPEAIYLPKWTALCPTVSVDIVKRMMGRYGLGHWDMVCDVRIMKTDDTEKAHAAALLPINRLFNIST